MVYPSISSSRTNYSQKAYTKPDDAGPKKKTNEVKTKEEPTGTLSLEMLGAYKKDSMATLHREYNQAQANADLTNNLKKV